MPFPQRWPASISIPRVLLSATWALVGLLLTPSWTQAVGLSNIQVQSKLNQRFKAHIELVSSEPIDAENLHASLASAADFARVGYERPFLLSQLRFKPVTLDDGRTLIRISSKESIKEPYLKFLVELSRRQGRIVRAYSVMLEPNRHAPAKPKAQSQMAQHPQTAFKRPSNPVTPKPRSTTAKAVAPSTDRHTGLATTPNYPLSYGPVNAGDTLWSIASALRPRGASVEQVLMALYRNNPDAFPSAHISDLKAGHTLRISSPDELFLLDKKQARLAFQDQESR
jgi:pilus assembly protein FimV